MPEDRAWLEVIPPGLPVALGCPIVLEGGRRGLAPDPDPTLPAPGGPRAPDPVLSACRIDLGTYLGLGWALRLLHFVTSPTGYDDDGEVDEWWPEAWERWLSDEVDDDLRLDVATRLRAARDVEARTVELARDALAERAVEARERQAHARQSWVDGPAMVFGGAILPANWRDRPGPEVLQQVRLREVARRAGLGNAGGGELRLSRGVQSALGMDDLPLWVVSSEDGESLVFAAAGETADHVVESLALADDADEALAVIEAYLGIGVA